MFLADELHPKPNTTCMPLVVVYKYDAGAVIYNRNVFYNCKGFYLTDHRCASATFQTFSSLSAESVPVKNSEIQPETSGSSLISQLLAAPPDFSVPISSRTIPETITLPEIHYLGQVLEAQS